MHSFCKKRQTRIATKSFFLIIGIAAFSMIWTGSVSADHLEGDQLATGKPEHFLSGIEVYVKDQTKDGLVLTTPVADVIKKFGTPTTKSFEPGCIYTDKEGETRSYEWVRKGLRMGVLTDYYKGRESGVYSVGVAGNAPRGGIGVTGQGLKLGSTFQEQKAIYGSHFFISSRNKGKVKVVLLEWADGTQMSITYGPNERITNIGLNAKIE
ncbi:MAG: hypothetical protein ABSC48_08205 [Terracidiphilus sp.]